MTSGVGLSTCLSTSMGSLGNENHQPRALGTHNHPSARGGGGLAWGG